MDILKKLSYKYHIKNVIIMNTNDYMDYQIENSKANLSYCNFPIPKYNYYIPYYGAIDNHGKLVVSNVYADDYNGYTYYTFSIMISKNEVACITFEYFDLNFNFLQELELCDSNNNINVDHLAPLYNDQFEPLYFDYILNKVVRF